jgi:hypothetical protein
MNPPITGGCLCGAVRYEITAPITSLRACHCLNCQKHTGGGGSVNALVQAEHFRVTKGEPRQYDDAATKSGRTLSRFFCPTCASPLFSRRNPDIGIRVVRAGSLDDSSGLELTAHIWTSTARPWDFIDPSTERHPDNPPPPPGK